MADKFTVAYDRTRQRLELTMRGFWTMADVGAFAAAAEAEVMALGAPPYRFDSLADARDFAVQSREVSEALGALDQAGEKMRTGRKATVVASVMNKMQAERTLAGDTRAFLTMAEAEAWLDQPEDGA